MKLKGLIRDLSGGLSTISTMTAALIGIFFAGWKIAGLPFVPFDSFDLLTRALSGNVLGLGIGVMVDVIRAFHLGPTSEKAKTSEHAIAIGGLLVMGVAGGAVLFSILRTRRNAHPASLGLVLGIVLGLPAMLISVHASPTSTVGPATRAVWILVTFLAWGTILGRTDCEPALANSPLVLRCPTTLYRSVESTHNIALLEASYGPTNESHDSRSLEPETTRKLSLSKSKCLCGI